MRTRRLWVIAIAFGCVAQQGPSAQEPGGKTEVSGRIVDSAGTAMADLTVNFRADGAAVETALTSADGIFRFDVAARREYEIWLQPMESKTLGRAVVTDGKALDLGTIAFRRDGSVGLESPPRVIAQRMTAGAIAATWATCDSHHQYCEHNSFRVLLGDGTEVQPPKEHDQVGVASVALSGDERTAGWLADSDFCCTSYPIGLELVIYRPGKPLRTFHGDGRAIFAWTFLASGTRVAFYQDFLHGTSWQHYELRDVETGRLISQWNGALSARSPKWAAALPH